MFAPAAPSAAPTHWMAAEGSVSVRSRNPARSRCSTPVRQTGAEHSQSFVLHTLFLSVIAMVTEELATTEAHEGFFFFHHGLRVKPLSLRRMSGDQRDSIGQRWFLSRCLRAADTVGGQRFCSRNTATCGVQYCTGQPAAIQGCRFFFIFL